MIQEVKPELRVFYLLQQVFRKQGFVQCARDFRDERPDGVPLRTVWPSGGGTNDAEL